MTHIAESDFVIVPKCAATHFEDFTKAEELAEIGRNARALMTWSVS